MHMVLLSVWYVFYRHKSNVVTSNEKHILHINQYHVHFLAQYTINSKYKYWMNMFQNIFRCLMSK